MLLNSPKTDPIVEILRLAYRRGLAIRQELAGENHIDESTNSTKTLEEDKEQSASTESDRSERSWGK